MSGICTKSFPHILQSITKPKASILPKKTPENIILCIYMRIVKTLLEEVEAMGSYPVRLPLG